MELLKIYLMWLPYFCVCIHSLPTNFRNSQRSYLYIVNGIDHVEGSSETSNKNLSGEVTEIVLSAAEHQDSPWGTITLSLRSSFPSPDRRRFSHFYRKKPDGESISRDPIIFPIDESPKGADEATAGVTGSTSTQEDSEGKISRILSYPDERLIMPVPLIQAPPENVRIPIDDLTSWLWENLKLPIENVSSPETPELRGDDISTQSLYHGPKFKKGRYEKMTCPPGQRANQFGECKRPVTLKQSEE